MSLKLCKLNIRRLMALLLCLMLLFTCAPAAQATGGGCGSGLSWSYSDGILAISGSGAMTEYPNPSSVPWYAYRDSITGISLPKGLTSVGSYAFYGCSQLATLDVPDTVRAIGAYAFAECRQMQLLDLGNSLQSIGEGAFYSCRSIVSLRLPGALKSIGTDAFYDCTGISALTIPENVTSVGPAAFAYCTGLVQVDIRCRLTSLPEWIFFGCKLLKSVNIPTSVTSADSTSFQQCNSLQYLNRGNETLDKSSLQQTEAPSSTRPSGSGISYGTGTEAPDGSIHIQTNTVVENENSSINTSVDYNSGKEDLTISSDITVTVENDKGWQEVLPPVQDALEEFDSQEDENITRGESNVTVYVKDAETIDQEFVDSLAGKNVNVTFVSKDGSVWQVKGPELSGESNSASYDMRYELQPASEEICRKVGTSSCYLLTFRESGEINAEVLIRLDIVLAMQEATLLQDGEAIDRIQTTVIDADGYAHFYLGSVDKKTEYYIAINMAPLPGEESNDAIIPEPLHSAYGNPVNIQPVKYEITGRKSSWNMGLGQVMGILAAVMIGAVALVGLIMYLWNKERLKNGYVPEWDDEE